MIYLDNAATTYPKPECVYEALDNANRNLAFNAGRGSYKEAKEVSDMIQDTRAKVAALIGLGPETVSFESSATEALNIIINGLDLKDGDNVYISPFEHNAVVRPLYNLQKKIKVNIRILPFDKKTWDIDETRMNDLFSMYKPKACFLTHISNVTGYILPLDSIFNFSKLYGSINIVDCSQSFGILNPPSKNIDFIVFAGHKSLYASFGIAGFININGYKLEISKSGGTGSDSLNFMMPENGYSRYESGSINSVAIAGLNKSIDWLRDNDIYNHEKELTNYLFNTIFDLKNVDTFIPGNGYNKILGILSILVNGYSPQDVGQILADDYGICVRTGYHCCPYIHDFLGTREKGGTVRISIGYFTTRNDIDKLINAITELEGE